VQKVAQGSRSVAVDEDVPEAAYHPAKQLRAAQKPAGAKEPKGARAIIEVQRNLGGMRWRALLGGMWVPGDGNEVATEVGVADAETLKAQSTCPSLLNDHHPYRAGLTDEFAPHVLGGVQDGIRQSACGPGTIAIDRAGFDDESSGIIFHLAGRTLAVVLVAIARGDDAMAAALKELNAD
jgi:hypothetical protein